MCIPHPQIRTYKEKAMNLPPSVLWEKQRALHFSIFLCDFSFMVQWVLSLRFFVPSPPLGVQSQLRISSDGQRMVSLSWSSMVIHPTGIVSLLGVIHSRKWIDDHLPIWINIRAIDERALTMASWHMENHTCRSCIPMDSTMAPITPTALHNSNRNDQLLPFRLAERWSIRF